MFWRLQTGVWTMLFVILSVAVIPYLGTRSHLENVEAVFANKFALALAGFVLTSAIRRFYDAWLHARPLFLIAGVLAFSGIGGNLASAFSNGTRMLLLHQTSWEFRDLVGGGTTGVLLLLSWSAGYLALRAWQEAQEARALAVRSQLAVLRYQVNPHFLFNSLNTLQSLIREDPRRASDAVSDLAAFLRYSLRNLSAENAPLGEELDAIRRYLAVEQARFEEKLDVAVTSDRRANEYLAPSFLLHPLVENAIKHGMQTSDLPLHVEIIAESSGADLRVHIRNTGHWREGINGTGIGLRNLRERLERLYPNRHRLETREANGWVESRLEIRGA